MSTAIIMVGASGAGKSTWIKNNAPNITICSADHWFMTKNDTYDFDWQQLGLAHGACLKRFVRHIIYGGDIICDNTNTTADQVAPYVALAQAYGYAVRIIILTPDSKVCMARNIKNVPPKTIERMTEQVEALIDAWPSHWPSYELQEEEGLLCG